MRLANLRNFKYEDIKNIPPKSLIKNKLDIKNILTFFNFLIKGKKLQAVDRKILFFKYVLSKHENDESHSLSSISEKKSINNIKYVGSGAYGRVFRVSMDGRDLILKLSNNELPNKLLERYISLKTSYISRYIIDYMYTGNIPDCDRYKYYSIMKYGGKTLRSYVRNNELSIDILRKILFQFYEISKFITNSKQLLTDFKLGNLTIDNNNNIKIIDIYMYCAKYPNYKCRIVKTYPVIELELESHIYQNDNYPNTYILIPMTICILDTLCYQSCSNVMDEIAKEYDLKHGNKDAFLILQLATCLRTNGLKNIKDCHKIVEFKNKMEKNYGKDIFHKVYSYFIEQINIKYDFIKKDDLIAIINNFMNADYTKRDYRLIKKLFIL